MLFRLISGEDVFELNPGLKAIPEFKDLSSRRMMFVCLVADTDHDNPIGSLPERQRRERAARIVGYPMEVEKNRPDKNARNLINGKVEDVEKAIAAYRLNQFDEDKANIAAVDKQIQEAREMMALDKTEAANGDIKLAFELAEKAIKLGQGITKLIETRKELNVVIQAKSPVKLGIETGTAADLPEEEGDEEKSTIDRVMENDQTNRQ